MSDRLSIRCCHSSLQHIASKLINPPYRQVLYRTYLSTKQMLFNMIMISNQQTGCIKETLLESIFDSFEQYNDLFQQTWNQLLSERFALVIGSQEIHVTTCKQETLFSQRTCRLCKTKLLKYGVHFNYKVSPAIDPRSKWQL